MGSSHTDDRKENFTAQFFLNSSVYFLCSIPNLEGCGNPLAAARNSEETYNR